MAVDTNCPSCKASFKVAEDVAGKQVRCPYCKQTFEVFNVDEEPSDQQKVSAGDTKPIAKSQEADTVSSQPVPEAASTMASPTPGGDPEITSAATPEVRRRGEEAEEVAATISVSGDAPSGGVSWSNIRFKTTTTSTHTFGDYELLDEIARGGMGVVFKARQMKANRVVALKMIRSGNLAGQDEVDRFYTEAEAAANLDHPNIVPVYDVGQIDAQHYFSMGFVDGPSLKDRVDDGPLPARDAARLLQTITDAVAYAHDKGIIHRDLKPGNILLDRSGTPKITDFGLAKQMDSDSELTASGQVMGTPQFMPPEQAAGKIDEVGPAADVYSLGAILYQLLTGRPPFQAASALETLRQVLGTEPPAPGQLNPAIDRDLETICLKCLEKEIGRRYGSAHELADELGRYLAGQPIHARPISRPARAWRWCKRNPIVASLATTAILFLVVGTIVSTSLAYVANEQKRIAEDNAEKFRQAMELAESETARANDKASEAEQERNRADAERKEAQIQRDEAERQRNKAERQLYFNHIQSAHQYWINSNSAAAWPHLYACRENLRNWEFNYLRSLFNRTHETCRLHTASINSAAFSPDGMRIVSGSHEGAVKVWDPGTGEETLTLAGHPYAVFAVAFSPDGRVIASGSHDKTVKLWDAETGQQLRTLEGHTGRVGALAFSPDGSKIVTASDDKTLKLWNANTGEPISTYQGHVYVVRGVSFHPKGDRFVSGALDGILKVWDVATTDEFMTLKADANYGTRGVAFSPDGERIASGDSDGMVRVWNAENGIELLTIDAGTDVYSLGFSADGKKLASGGENMMVNVWDASNGDRLASYQGHTSYVLAVAFSPDGEHVVSGGIDTTLRLWDLQTNTEPTVVETAAGYINGLAISPDGANILSAGQQTTPRLCDAQSGEQGLAFRGHRRTLHSSAFNTDGSRLVTGDDSGVIKLWNATSGEELLSFNEHRSRVTSLAFRPDGSRFVSGSSDGTFRVWDAITGELLSTNSEHTHTVDSVAFSPDGKRIVSGGQGVARNIFGEAHVWDAESGKKIFDLVGHANLVGSVCYSPDGRQIVSGSHDNKIKMWDAETGDELFTCDGHTNWVTCVAFSPDGTRIVSAGRDKTVKLWDARTGEEALTLDGHTDMITSVLFSPDGSSIFSAGMDRKVIRWDSTRESAWSNHQSEQ